MIEHWCQIFIIISFFSIRDGTGQIKSTTQRGRKQSKKAWTTLDYE